MRASRLFTSIPAPQHLRFSQLASIHGVSSSKLLALMVDRVLAKQAASGDLPPTVDGVGIRKRCSTKYTVRLQGDEAMRLQQRSSRRGMQPSSYAAHVLRAHLRKDPPLPYGEFAQIKRLVNELSGVRGMLMEVVQRDAGAGRLDTQVIDAITRLLPSLKSIREDVRASMDANVRSWALGDE